jgi:PKD repeat protein
MSRGNDSSSKPDNGEIDDIARSESRTSSDDGGSPVFKRRSVLKLSAVAALGSAASGLTSTVSAEPTHHGIEFDRVVDAVDDLGMDPTGEQPIDDAFNDAVQTGTLIEFPPGRYLTEQRHLNTGVERFGVRGLGSHRRDVQFFPPSGEGVAFIGGGGPGPYLVENITFDELDDTSSMMWMELSSDGGNFVSQVEWIGQSPDDSHNNFHLNIDVRSQDGVSVYEHLYAGHDQPAVKADYPNGIAFFRGGPGHEGEVVLRDSDIRLRNSAATRVTNAPGVVTMERCAFHNNQNNNIRIGCGDHPTKVSSATDCYVYADGTRDTADAIRLDSSGNGHSGSVYRNIDIEWTKDSGRGAIAFPSFGDYGRAEFYDCRIRNEGSNTPVINADSTSTSDDDVIVEGCSLSGSGEGIDVSDRPGSVIRDSCFDMPNGTISGMAEENVSYSGCSTPSDPENDNEAPTASLTTSTDGLSVSVDGSGSSDPDGTLESYSWDFGDGATGSGQTASHTYSTGGNYTVSLTVTDDAGATATATSDVSVTDPNSEPSAEITVTEKEDLTVDLSGAESADPDGDLVAYDWEVGEDTYTGTTVTHTFPTEGTYGVSLTVEDDAGATDSTSSDVTVATSSSDTLRIQGTGTTTEYSFEVDGELTPDSDTIEQWDDVSDTGATGWVTETEDVDRFTFTGDFTTFEFLRGEADVFVNGELVDPTSSSSPSSLSIQGTGTTTEYSFEVDGELTPDSDTIEQWDDVSGTGATGWVTETEDVDRFTFTGEITTFEFLQGEADVFVDGERTDPTS